jgi:hypothetical protein
VIHVPPRLLAQVEGVDARTTVFMIDKPRLIRDLLGGADVRYEPVDVGRYDLVVDATGVARAYAPPFENNLKARVLQWRVRVREPVATCGVRKFGSGGVAVFVDESTEAVAASDIA